MVDHQQRTHPDSREPEWTSRQGILWHFGRFRGDSPKRPPYNQVLVGREKERASFIRQLLNLPKRSAFLITGSRGSGKTRFTDYCLDAYEENLLARYMRTDAGRTFYWDKIMLFVILFLAAISISLFREITFLVVQPKSFVTIFLAVPFVVIGIIPVVYAEKLSTMMFNNIKLNSGFRALSYFITYGVFLLSFIIPSEFMIFLISIALVIVYLIHSYKSTKDSWNVFLFLFQSLLLIGFWEKPYYFSGLETAGILSFLSVILIIVFIFFDRHPRPEERKIIKHNHAKCLFYNVAIFLFISLKVEYFPFGKSTLILNLFIILFMLFSMGSLNKNTPSSLIKGSEPKNTLLFFLLLLKILFLVSMCSSIFLPTLQHFEFLASPINNTLNSFSSGLAQTADTSQDLIFQWLSIPILFLILFILEYDLIILPQGYRLFVAGTNPIWRKNATSETQPNQVYSDSQLEAAIRKTNIFSHSNSHVKYTFFWLIFNTWLPIMTIRINLGFDTLDYRRVVEAMLLGLKKAYHRQFLSFSSFFANIQRVFVLLIFCCLSSVIGHEWFLSNQKNLQDTAATQVPLAPDLSGSTKAWVNNLPSFFSNLLYWKIFSDERRVTESQQPLTLEKLFPNNVYSEAIPSSKPGDAPKRAIHIEVYFYNFFLILSFYFIYFAIRRKSVLFPYNHAYRDINRMLAKFTSKTSGSIQEAMPFKLPGLGNNLTKKMGWESDLLDPRTLELEFISLLNRAQYPGIPLLHGPEHRITLPQSEITFIFDELDKLGVRSFGDNEEEHLSGEHLILEKRRSVAIQNLLANMKNLLSSGSARYIFIGGRDMHDEWVADRAQRVPFLTNIFDAEIYLPSLLTDHPVYQAERMDWSARIKEFLIIQFNTGLELWREMAEFRFNAMPEHSSISRFENSYNDFNVAELSFEHAGLTHERNLYVCNQNSSEVLFKYGDQLSKQDIELQRAFRQDFLYFLTFKSYGNPKLLNALLNSFIVNLEVVNYRSPNSKPQFLNGEAFSIENTSEFLYFDYKAIYRIQMISSIYRIIANRFERKLIFGDDKPVVTLFYIVNFLLKFHRRGFSWTSIEHVDELVHVHKSLETRHLIKDVIEEWSDNYLDRIRNGIFDFRFGHDIAAELRLLSKFHLDELAAFNFTLDESRHLKALYRKLLDSEGEHPNFEYFAVLGELHEYDGDFLYARNYFHKALKHLDRAFLQNPLLEKLHLNVEASEFIKAQAGTTSGDPIQAGQDPSLAVPNLTQFLNELLTTPKMFQTTLDWATSRLRFLLRIAMTYELANHFESARLHYHTATQFSQALYLAWKQQTFHKDSQKDQTSITFGLNLAKTLNIIFLPNFAEAWAMEKTPATLDAGVGMLDKHFSQIQYDFTDWVKNFTGLGPEGKTVHHHINFYVILAELLHKLGDMYFTKGKNLIPSAAYQKDPSPQRTRGFLSVAACKYMAGLKFLLIYLNLRLTESGLKYSQKSHSTNISATFSQHNQPDYFIRVFLGIVRDLAFTMMAKISTHGLFQSQSPTSSKARSSAFKLNFSCAPKNGIRRFLKPLDRDLDAFLKVDLDLENLDAQFKTLKLISFQKIIDHETKPPQETVSAFFALQLAASKQLLRANYPGKAIRSYLQTAETAQHYLEWMLLYLILGKVYGKNVFKGSAFWEQPQKTLETLATQIFYLGLYCLSQAKEISQNRGHKERQIQTSHLMDGLENVRHLFAQFELNLDKKTWQTFRTDTPTGKLLKSIQNNCKHSLFPFGFRLRGLKTLSDHLALSLLMEKFVTPPPNQSPIAKAYESLAINLDELNREILFLDQQFDNNYIFSPFYQGVTFALTYLYFENAAEKNEDNKARADFWRKHAYDYLNRSKQMYTQGRTYYDFISNHYFLYEDFNDREFQFGHAIQMAGSGVTALLLDQLRRDTT